MALLEDLPVELLLAVFDYLDRRTLLKMATVSRSLVRAVQQVVCQKFQERLSLMYNVRDCSGDVFAASSDHVQQLRAMYMTGLSVASGACSPAQSAAASRSIESAFCLVTGLLTVSTRLAGLAVWIPYHDHDDTLLGMTLRATSMAHLLHALPARTLTDLRLSLASTQSPGDLHSTTPDSGLHICREIAELSLPVLKRLVLDLKHLCADVITLATSKTKPSLQSIEITHPAMYALSAPDTTRDWSDSAGNLQAKAPAGVTGDFLNAARESVSRRLPTLLSLELRASRGDAEVHPVYHCWCHEGKRWEAVRFPGEIYRRPTVRRSLGPCACDPCNHSLSLTVEFLHYRKRADA